MRTRLFITLVGAAIIGLVVLALHLHCKGGICEIFPWQDNVITSFEECSNAGYPVMESFPRQCKTPDGKTFIENTANSTAQIGDKAALSAKVSSISPNDRVMRLDLPGSPIITFADNTLILDSSGGHIGIQEIRRGFSVEVNGSYVQSDVVLAKSIRIVSADPILVTSPKVGSVIQSPVQITGEARIEGNAVHYRVVERGGNVLAEGSQATQPQGPYKPFSVATVFAEPTRTEGEIELYDDTQAQGLVVRIPVKFPLLDQKSTAAVYFPNSMVDPDSFYCDTTYPTQRFISGNGDDLLRSTLLALLEGPTTEEEQRGFGTAIPPGVIIQSLVVEGSTVRVDFSESMGDSVAGSCRVGAIRSQIENTLKQFPDIEHVIISVSGNVEEALQP